MFVGMCSSLLVCVCVCWHAFEFAGMCLCLWVFGCVCLYVFVFVFVCAIKNEDILWEHPIDQ